MRGHVEDNCLHYSIGGFFEVRGGKRGCRRVGLQNRAGRSPPSVPIGYAGREGSTARMRVIICGPAGSGKTTLMNRILEGACPGTLVLDEIPATPPTLTAGSFWIIVTQDLERIPIFTRAASTMLYTATPGSDHRFDVAFNRAAVLALSDPQPPLFGDSTVAPNGSGSYTSGARVATSGSSGARCAYSPLPGAPMWSLNNPIRLSEAFLRFAGGSERRLGVPVLPDFGERRSHRRFSPALT